jgi:hypothetical protein
MTVIRPYVAEHERAVAEFNARLRAGGAAFSFRGRAPREGDAASAFVALDVDRQTGRSAVRGGYVGVRHPFVLFGENVDVYHLKLPLSESTIDVRYNAVGLQLIVDAERRYPLAFALGMGGRHNALPRILASRGWSLRDVPFFFRVIRPSRVLRHLAWLRTTRLRSLALDALAASGIGAAFLSLHAGLPWRARRDGDLRTKVVADWRDGDFVDRIWARARSNVALVARRDAARLAELYPVADQRCLRLDVERAGEPIGWALLLDTQLAGHAHFGDMRLGCLVDALAQPGEERHVVQAATRVLRRRGVDLIVSNQSAPGWCEAMRANRWIEGPSNYVLALSTALSARLGAATVHMTRGDGDGPVHL